MLARPIPVLVISIATLWLWHLPAAYDLALRHQSVHDLEHLTMLATAILFWEQVIDTAPIRPTLDPIQLTLYVSVATVAGWLLAAVLAYWPVALYQPLRGGGPPARRGVRAGRPADRGRHHVGAGLAGLLAGRVLADLQLGRR